MMLSVTPSPSFQPYTFAVSKKLISRSRARSMIAKLSGSVVRGPKFIVPRQSLLTFRPVRPRLVYSMHRYLVGMAALRLRRMTVPPPQGHVMTPRDPRAFDPQILGAITPRPNAVGPDLRGRASQLLSRAAGAPPNRTSSQLGSRLRGFSPVPSAAGRRGRR